MGRVCVCVALPPSSLDQARRIGLSSGPKEKGRVCGATGGGREELRDLEPVVCL